jgi:glycosyltransferase involved in cell wall biosynthesis
MTGKEKLTITWISFLTLDQDLHSSSRVENLKQLSQMGHKVNLIVLHSKRKTATHDLLNIISLPMRYIPKLSPIIFGIAIFLYLPFHLIQQKPDFIILDPYTVNLGMLWSPIFKLAQTKFVLDIRTTPINDSKLKTILFHLTMMISNRFDGLSIITNGMRDEVSNNYGIPKNRFNVRSDAASLDVFSPKNISKDKITQLRKILGLSDKYVIIYHGSMTKARGIIDLTYAMKKIGKDHPEISLFFLGNGTAFAQIQSIKKEEELANVILHEPVPYEVVPEFIAMADIGIVPLPDMAIWRNQCPLKLLEYMAMEKPVIVTDIKCHREILQDDSCAIYLDSHEEKKIVDGILKAYSQRNYLEKCAHLNRRKIDEKYNWKMSAVIMEDHLYSLR